MATLIVLLIFWTPFLLARLLRAQHARPPGTGHPSQAHAKPPSWAITPPDSQDAPEWSALDDRQLTRLLTDSAPRTNTE